MSHDHHHHDHEEAGFRPSLGAFFNNFRSYDAPLAVKLQLAFRNTWLKISHNSSCCGNHGEPGC